jgi:hypothetical protein
MTQSGAEAPATEPATSSDVTTEAATSETTPAEPLAAAEPQPAPAQRPAATNPVSRFFGNLARSSTSDAFPMGSMHGDYLLPAQQQYFARLEQQRGTLVARGEAFPMGSAEGEHGYWGPLPSQVAYFDRVEQQRIAASQPQPVARAEIAPAPVSSSEQSAQAGSSEVAIADTSAIR